jgi:hypothetical protein
MRNFQIFKQNCPTIHSGSSGCDIQIPRSQERLNDTYFMAISLTTLIYSAFEGVSFIYETGKKKPEPFRMICQQCHLSDHLGEPNFP